jgi:hypothetical protein
MCMLGYHDKSTLARWHLRRGFGALLSEPARFWGRPID